MKAVNFVQWRRQAFTLSAVAFAVALLLLLVPGLNMGIDFAGGSLLERQVEQDVSTAEIRSVLAGLEDVDVAGAVIQVLDRPNEFLVRTHVLEREEIQAIDTALDTAFGGLVERRTEMVGPVIGRELVRQAIWALVLAAIGILIYVSVRFEYRYAVAAIAAALHDVIIVLGLLALTQREINTPFVAAILTVIGYSINDTIVIFDRIRENARFRKRKQPLEVMVNTSLNQTLPRTINTSITTLFVVSLLFIFGGAAIQDFAFALVVGVLIGTYSSVFIASPVWLEWNLRTQKQKETAAESA